MEKYSQSSLHFKQLYAKTIDFAIIFPQKISNDLAINYGQLNYLLIFFIVNKFQLQHMRQFLMI